MRESKGLNRLTIGNGGRSKPESESDRVSSVQENNYKQLHYMLQHFGLNERKYERKVGYGR